ncbi:hypothetical protein BAUCODRAFT_119315 [Baudoinia panamericana UAMH 10762]|uniref:Zn(2)-C6 fungal-type domain-containing protein n=1 Tax=Baudoinia panamericana (strain UAMH 10762) TaxID=717646 RepID=M2NKQ8_BAUPA|nr:uncharacterized protein BAUCODRAFT_119315 [Baudoinia panamericana UAMH 10762]EMC99730.1 hypothetical protein BAUCODRAFT_119315 [Baudoinia panamericana UAMH 10762]
MSTPQTALSSNGDEHHHVKLACQGCQRKKIKCDRTFPCGQCTRSNLQCIPSTRKPRVRHGGKRAVDSELRSRITKLESLVESLSGEVGLQHTPEHDEDASNETHEAPEVDTPSRSVGRYLGSSFWDSLSTEVQAIRDALEEDQDADGPDAHSNEDKSGSGAPLHTGNEFDLLICPPGTTYIMPGALNEPPPPMQQYLYETFIANVDPAFKVFHTPSLRAFFERGAPYLGHEATAPCNKALKTVAWFAAVNTMTDEQCRTQLGGARLDLLHKYRRTVDVALAQADLCNTTDLATLQAFAVYLVSIRMTDLSRRVWSLTALLVRIARAFGLHSKAPARTPFETELRRRLWYCIRFVDAFAALDRATEVIVDAKSFDTPFPNNVNDTEFDENSPSIPNHEGCITDMGFGLLVYTAVKATLRMTVPEYNATGDTWQRRLDDAREWGRDVHERYLQHCDMSKPFQRLIYYIGKSMSASMVLRAVRPVQRHMSSVPPRIDDPYVLRIAVDCLAANERIYTDREFDRWRWLIWVQWHALAVALAGLCSIRGTELAVEAWKQVETNYERQNKVRIPQA